MYSNDQNLYTTKEIKIDNDEWADGIPIFDYQFLPSIDIQLVNSNPQYAQDIYSNFNNTKQDSILRVDLSKLYDYVSVMLEIKTMKNGNSTYR